MSKNNTASVRGIHVSPGIYTAESEISYAVKSLGITSLGLAGETLKGPAFQPIHIENWREFTSVFGATSPEKFDGSKYPKYELPYIAKSYLTESDNLYVCRVLGLSGYNAGPAWVVTAENESGTKMPIVVLRSRGYYTPYKHVVRGGENECCESTVYDGLNYRVGEKPSTSTTCESKKEYNMGALTIVPYKGLESDGNECKGYTLKGGNSNNLNINSLNYGRFTLIGLEGESNENATATKYHFQYSVSLNPNDKDYILKVLGTNQHNGNTPIYVEALYDVALKQGVESGNLTKLSDQLTAYIPYQLKDYCKMEPVYGLMTTLEAGLTRKYWGRRYLATQDSIDAKITYHPKDANGHFTTATTSVSVGQVYIVAQYTDESGKRHYVYDVVTEDKLTIPQTEGGRSLVKNNEDGLYYIKVNEKTVEAVTCDMNNYRDGYRFASTPWIVSNVKGDASRLEMTKLFRFHTISDGNNANNEIKVSIANVKLDDRTFDVYIRDINDSDTLPVILEKYTRCNMVIGDPNYIAYKIGSFDGSYESKSKYVTVEVQETSVSAQNSVPCGFLGYPLSRFDGVQIDGNKVSKIIAPTLKYNVNFNEDIKHKKQYFGLSDIVGVDIDMFTYKGQAAYGEGPEYLCDGFHLDCRVDSKSYGTNEVPTIIVDGVKYNKWQAVSVNNRTALLNNNPIIDTEVSMSDSLYSYVDLRKFTVYFYGGFDGWDEYRDHRSNTDEFKQTQYKGDYDSKSGEGYQFNMITDPETLGLNQKGITSDWYAYLAAIRQFANPEDVDINILATPGIDLINNKLLCNEVIDMIEEERADSIYVATLPDKPLGASDFESDMYDATDIVSELEDTEITSNYTCTYYPWVKYEDVDSAQYIMLPPTKDVVRNMAQTDNVAQPWFTPAGITRGNVECVRAHKVTKISEEDTLYEGRINPIKTFATEGVKVWGNKNLQPGDALLTRIHVRRLLLRMRKLIAVACIGLIFEPNDTTTRNKFLSLVSPIMDNIKANRGISDYRIEVEDSIESRERRELNCAIYFKPYNSLEYINIRFNVTNEGVNFDEI